MSRAEKKNIVQWAATLTDEQIEQEYYDAVYACLGSEAEEMFERGYAMEDIIERERYERYISMKADILESICHRRGIKLWGDKEGSK